MSAIRAFAWIQCGKGRALRSDTYEHYRLPFNPEVGSVHVRDRPERPLWNACGGPPRILRGDHWWADESPPRVALIAVDGIEEGDPIHAERPTGTVAGPRATVLAVAHPCKLVRVSASRLAAEAAARIRHAGTAEVAREFTAAHLEFARSLTRSQAGSPLRLPDDLDRKRVKLQACLATGYVMANSVSTNDQLRVREICNLTSPYGGDAAASIQSLTGSTDRVLRHLALLIPREVAVRH